MEFYFAVEINLTEHVHNHAKPSAYIYYCSGDDKTLQILTKPF